MPEAAAARSGRRVSTADVVVGLIALGLIWATGGAVAQSDDGLDERLDDTSSEQPLTEEELDALGGPGMLELNSQPWSEVFVDGLSKGPTPVVGEFMEPGAHRIEFVCTACSPPRNYRDSVVVEPGRTRSLVHRFDDGWTRTKLSQPLRTSEKPTEPTSPMNRTLVPEVEAEATLLLNSKPWAVVSLNGYELGPVPLDLKVTPGQYEVGFLCHSCDPDQERTETVTVDEGQSVKLVVLFD